MRTCFTNVTLILPDRMQAGGWLLAEEGRIARLGTGVPPAADETVDCGGQYLAPGLIDLHCHGGGGGSFDALDAESHRKAMRTHLAHGVTSMTPTATTADPDKLRRLRQIREELAAEPGLPHHLGYFLEGPFNQPHPDLALGAAPPVLTEALYGPAIEAARGMVNRWMAAPELAGGMAFGRALREAGITGCIGHSNATFDEVVEAMDNGYRCVVHLYSVMSTVTRKNGFRSGGIVEAGLLLDDLDVEIICDGCHLPPELIRLAVRCKGYDRLMLVSDCGPLGGLPEGEYTMSAAGNEIPVVIEDGVCKPLARNCFLGSVACGDRLVRTVCRAGVPLWAAVRMASKTPARHAGYAGIKGELAVGCDADLILLDEEIRVQKVWLTGRAVETG